MRFVASSICVLLLFCSPAFAEECAATTSEALKQSRIALDAGDKAQTRKALECLTVAVKMLDARLEDLIAGKINFTGEITAPAFVYPTPTGTDADRPSKAGVE